MEEPSTYLEQAREFWRAGKTVAAGRLFFERVPPPARPAWAARTLNLVMKRLGVWSMTLELTRRVAQCPPMWRFGHRVFDRLRRQVLRWDDLVQQGRITEEQKRLHWVLCFAEIVAKVTYNATNPMDEFDEDSGWWIGGCILDLADELKDEKFAEAAWAALSGKDQ